MMHGRETVMPSLRIIYDVEGWAYFHQAVALRKYAPADFAISLGCLAGSNRSTAGQRSIEEARAVLGDSPVDIVFLLTATQTSVVRAALRETGWQSKLVAGWTDGVPRRYALFHQLYDQADAWIINNLAYWEAIGRLPRTYMIANGVDLEVFNVTRPPRLRTPKVLWTGSQLHRRLKGYDELIVLLQAKLRALGIDCETLLVDSYGTEKRSPAQMAAWYNSGTVLVCASESEGTPNPALEAAACGCTIVSTPVGNMPELIRHDVNGYLVDRDIGALLGATERACAHYLRLSHAMQNDIRGWHWARRSTDFFRVFRDVLAPQMHSTVERQLAQP